MSQLLSDMKIFEKIDFTNEIKYYHVYGYGQNNCGLFVTNEDKVYGINIPKYVMTPSYEYVIKNGNNSNLKSLEPIEISELCERKIKQFQIGFNFVLALSEENKLYSWGYNNCGQLGRSTESLIDSDPKELIYFTNSKWKIKQVCVYENTIMVLLDNGKVIVWGR